MTYYNTPATTLDDVIRQSRLKDQSAVDSTATVTSTIAAMDSNNLAFLKSLLYDVTDAMQKGLGRNLTPYYESKSFYAEYLNADNWFYDRHLQRRILVLDDVDGDDCLNISSLTWAGTALTSSDYRFRFPNSSPNYELTFNTNTSLDALDDFSDVITIAGTWGYHDRYSAMFADSGDTVQNATQITASGTSLTVTSGANFETYQLIRIESEYLFITAISSNTLTVERGVNGTTAAAHANATQIDTFVPVPAIAKECRRLVVRAYYLRNPLNNVFISGEQIKELVETDMNPPIERRNRVRFA